MASELSKFIEDEMARKGIKPDERETRGLMAGHMDIEGACRERYKTQQGKNAKRNICVFGSLIVVAVLTLVLIRVGQPSDQVYTPKATQGIDDINKTMATEEGGEDSKTAPSPGAKEGDADNSPSADEPVPQEAGTQDKEAGTAGEPQQDDGAGTEAPPSPGTTQGNANNSTSQDSAAIQEAGTEDKEAGTAEQQQHDDGDSTEAPPSPGTPQGNANNSTSQDSAAIQEGSASPGG